MIALYMEIYPVIVKIFCPLVKALFSRSAPIHSKLQKSEKISVFKTEFVLFDHFNYSIVIEFVVTDIDSA